MTATYKALLEEVLAESPNIGRYVIQTSEGQYIAKTGMMHVDVGRANADEFDSIDDAEAEFDKIVKDFRGMSVNQLTVVPA